MRKKLLIILGCLLLLGCFFNLHNQPVVFAEEQDQSVLEQIEKQTTEQLSNLDFKDIENLVSNLNEQSTNVFGAQTFWQKVQSVIDGDFENGFTSYFDAILGFACSDIILLVPFLTTIVSIAVLASLVGNLRGKFSSEAISSIVNFVVLLVVVVMVSAVVIDLFNSVKNIIEQISMQTSLLFPILLTLLASIGGKVSVSVFEPTVVILSSVIIKIFNAIVMPILIFMFVFVVVSNFSNNIRFDKLNNFFKSALKWFSTICFAVFGICLVINGVVAGSFDGVSIKAMRFALKSYVPVLGGYLSDGFNVVVASSVLIKNAVGVAGLLLLFASVLQPLLKIVIVILILKLAAGILEPICDTMIHGFLTKVADILKLLIMILLGVVFMYVLSIGLLLCSSNAF